MDFNGSLCVLIDFYLFFCFFCIFSFCFLVFFLCHFVVARKKMPYLFLWLSRVAADSKTSQSFRRHSGAASLIITLFVLCFICFVFCSFSGVNKQT